MYYFKRTTDEIQPTKFFYYKFGIERGRIRTRRGKKENNYFSHRTQNTRGKSEERDINLAWPYRSGVRS